MKNAVMTAKIKLTKTVITRYTRATATAAASTTDLTVTSVSTILGAF